ncbi:MULTISPECIES: DUF5677 domain-containing protein [Pseudomonadaceae]|uniref:DUF5677 domain-containing protein n=1 Tax=Stutzerimonas stutzeri TaxID=316 RepID=A0ABD4XW68_STUST|nr:MULTISPECIES: DUF5677 domain-containing protein [Pseudomonadaceae]MDH0687052.1 DUF5677 domain-containing protein [Stutzerimonas stutzeri]MDS9629014.1 DUF5677 domain-containing protein [Pseudomonas aeruginosa]
MNDSDNVRAFLEILEDFQPNMLSVRNESAVYLRALPTMWRLVKFARSFTGGDNIYGSPNVFVTPIVHLITSSGEALEGALRCFDVGLHSSAAALARSSLERSVSAYYGLAGGVDDGVNKKNKSKIVLRRTMGAMSNMIKRFSAQAKAYPELSPRWLEINRISDKLALELNEAAADIGYEYPSSVRKLFEECGMGQLYAAGYSDACLASHYDSERFCIAYHQSGKNLEIFELAGVRFILNVAHVLSVSALLASEFLHEERQESLLEIGRKLERSLKLLNASENKTLKRFARCSYLWGLGFNTFRSESGCIFAIKQFKNFVIIAYSKRSLRILPNKDDLNYCLMVSTVLGELRVDSKVRYRLIHNYERVF